MALSIRYSIGSGPAVPGPLRERRFASGPGRAGDEFILAGGPGPTGANYLLTISF